jgi:hypothetical protein
MSKDTVKNLCNLVQSARETKTELKERLLLVSDEMEAREEKIQGLKEIGFISEN